MRQWVFPVGAVLLLTACSEPEVVAKVGGERITRAELELRGRGRSGAAPSATLDQLIERALLAEGAVRAGLEAEPEIAARLAQARREILANAMLDRTATEKVTDAALRARYERTPQTRRAVHVAQLVVRFDPSDPRSKVQAQTRINTAYARIRDGADFAEVVRELSDDQATRGRGGDLGVIEEGQVEPRFFEAVHGLEEGAVSPPFETAFGLHLAKALAAPTEERVPFERLKGQLAAEARRDAEAALLAELREDTAVKTYPERLPNPAAAPAQRESGR